MAKYIHEPLEMLTKTGPLNYRAPETFVAQIYSEKIDIWSAGVVAYELLTGNSPFPSQYEAEKIQQICTCEPDYELVPV